MKALVILFVFSLVTVLCLTVTDSVKGAYLPVQSDVAYTGYFMNVSFHPFHIEHVDDLLEIPQSPFRSTHLQMGTGGVYMNFSPVTFPFQVKGPPPENDL